MYWEVTRACDLACQHCRAEAVPACHPDELKTAEARRILESLAAAGEPRPRVILTGGDPLKRRDLFELIAIARGAGLGVSVAPSATPLLTPTVLANLKAAGVEAISLSLDGSCAPRHDAIRGITGTYARTIAAAGIAGDVGMPFQINTLVCTQTANDLAAIYDTVVKLGAARWSLFFLVAVGRGQRLQSVSPEEAERLLTWAASLSSGGADHAPIVTTTEAPQFRRIVLQQRRRTGAPAPAKAHPGAPAHAAAGIRDGNGIVFISHTGNVSPSGFLEIPIGNVRQTNLMDIYQAAPLFRLLRDADMFRGRCGRCEYRWICGGSRARAYAASGDPLAEDPLCCYQPGVS